MASKTHIEKSDLNLFGQSPSLLFQFILSEFLTAFKLVQRIEKSYHEMENLLIKRRLMGAVDESLNQLLASIVGLTGTSIINEDPSPWATQKGCLSKLRHYCNPFVKLEQPEEKTVENINICVSKAFHSALQAREVILYLQLESHKPKHIPDYAMLYQLLDRLIDNLNRVSRLLLRVILQFRNDENVVFFMLRNRESFDTLYKTNFVSKIFRKMYPNGIEEVGQLLMKKYSERGFNNLLNTIAKKISELAAIAS